MPVTVTVAAAIAGGALATALRVPAGALIGAMIAVGVLKITGVPTVTVPDAVRFGVYCAVGLLLGLSFSADSLRQLRGAAVPILLVVILFVLFGFLVAWGLWRFAGFDVYTAFLAAAPGGIAQMGVFSAEAKANVPLVLAVHVLRIMSVILITAVGLKLLGGR